MPRFVPILMFACLFGCAEVESPPSLENPRELPLRVSVSGLSAVHSQAVRDAVQEWYAATGLRIEVGTNAAVTATYGPDKTDYGDYVHYKSGREELRIRTDLYGRLLHTVLLHELGHALGFSHESQGIMRVDAATFGQRIACIDQFTLHKLCDAYACVDPAPTCDEVRMD